MAEKIVWAGEIVGIQPRIRLLRSFDQRSHSYLGYAVDISGEMNGEPKRFRIGIGPGAQKKHELRRGDRCRGLCEPVAKKKLDPVDYYKVTRLERLARAEPQDSNPPPWNGPAPALEVYRERGHRRLAARTYNRACGDCIWGCSMAVEIIVDHWKPDVREYRTETFCYGPKSCPVYASGPTRKVPGRKSMTWEEEDWVDEEETAHRGPDD